MILSDLSLRVIRFRSPPQSLPMQTCRDIENPSAWRRISETRSYSAQYNAFRYPSRFPMCSVRHELPVLAEIRTLSPAIPPQSQSAESGRTLERRMTDILLPAVRCGSDVGAWHSPHREARWQNQLLSALVWRDLWRSRFGDGQAD